MQRRDEVGTGLRRIGPILGAVLLGLLGCMSVAVAGGWPYGALAWAGETTVEVLEQAEFRVLLAEGETTPGGGELPVLNLGLPTVDAAGHVGFTGRLDDGGAGDGFVWLDGTIAFRDSQAQGVALVGAAPQLGLAGGTRYLFRAQIDGKDALWSDQGLVARAGETEPLLDGATIVNLRRPVVAGDGRYYWLALYKGAGGAGRALFTRASDGGREVLLRSGDAVVGGVIAKPRGLDLAYDISTDGAHHVHIVELEAGGGSSIVPAILLDGQVVLRVGDPAGPGEVWERFRGVAVSSSGHWVVSGETSAPSDTDTVFASDGEVRLREGDAVGEVTLREQASVLAVDIDDRGRVAQLWSTAGFGRQFVLFSCSGAEVPQSTVVLRTRSPAWLPSGEEVVAGFEATGHGSALRLGGGDRLYVWVDLVNGEGQSRQAVVATRLPPCPQ